MYNSTIVEPYYAAFSAPESASTYGELRFVNNAVYYSYLSAGNVCGVTTSAADDVDHNYWSTQPTDTDCQGANDVTGGTPGFTDTSSAVTFRDAYGSGTFPDRADFMPTAGSPLRNAADTACISETKSWMTGAGFGRALDEHARILSAELTEAQWLTTCEAGMTDIGAVQYSP